jgi:CcmD family protein
MMAISKQVMTERWGRRALQAAILAATLFVHTGTAAPALAAQPPTTAAQEGFLPLDESKVQERLPAVPLLMTAYAAAWLVIFGYVWSLWSRLSRVEREIKDVSRRMEAGGRR